MNPIIKALQDDLAKERDEYSRNYQYICDKNSKHLAGRMPTPMETLMSEDAFYDGHEAASARLLPILEQAIEVIDGLYNKAYIAAMNDSISAVDRMKLCDRLSKAREFLTTLADASGEINKEGK